VNNTGTRFIIFLFGDPHLLEGGQRGQDGATDPYGVFPFRWGNDLDFDGGWSQGSDFLLHTIGNTRVHGGATRKNSVGVEVFPDINITLHNGVVDGLVNAAGFHAQEGWLEEGFRATESFIADGDDLSIRQFIGLFQAGGCSGGGHFLLKVQSDIAELFFDITDNLTFSSGGERVTSLSEDLHQVVSQVTASQVQPKDGMGQGITGGENKSRHCIFKDRRQRTGQLKD
jgi:hypothetical protein